VTTKTRSCDQCAWWTRQIDRCAKGHSPRFYQPKLFGASPGSWGWRRRCDDYEARTDGVPGQ
jgi:hypothetical protein